MSRAKKKMALITDLQNYLPRVILTKKDCDMIANALLNTYEFKEIKHLYSHLKILGTIKHGRKY